MAASIMVLNESKEIQELFHGILTEAGYTVTICSYGIEDLADIKRAMPDLLILDYTVGEEKAGWQLLQKMKMDRATAGIPIVICSGEIRRLQEMQGWLTEKGVGIVFKPFDADDLVRAVDKMLTVPAPVKKKGSKSA